MSDVAAITEWTRANRRARAAYEADKTLEDPAVLCVECGERPRYRTQRGRCNPCYTRLRKNRKNAA